LLSSQKLVNSSQPPSINNLLDQFNLCRQLRFNGNLDVQDTEGNTWIFYYRLGRIVWATGGNHPVRRFYRQLTFHCPQVNVKALKFSDRVANSNSWDYHILTLLYERQKLKPEQVNAVVESTITELLFDVIQRTVFSPLSSDHNQDEVLDVPLTLSSSDLFLQQAQSDWEKWQQAKLTKVSPNLAPKLIQSDQLKQQLSDRVYKNFSQLLTGKSTLRDLGVKMKQDPLKLTRSLLPYASKGMIKLMKIPDFPLPVKQKGTTPPKASTATSSSTPLIACIDDSPQVSEILKKILVPNDYRFIGIQDSVNAIPVLIEQKPSLIFLDLIMPVANGYEICSQLRRMSMFSDVPIIIVTGSDGIVDRVRAKMVGANGFMKKPIEPKKVLALAKKYTPLSG
jgi:chemotaxis family two-component system response regulator PixG